MRKFVTTILPLLTCILFMSACQDSNPLHQKTEAPPEPKTYNATFNFPIEKEVYIPIYSDIYSRTRSYKVLLAATLSIRNTSKSDTIYLKNVDYYDSAGHLVRNYLKKPIYLHPLETVDYVIDEADEAGGSGANFLLTWGAKQELNPVIQAVMLGSIGQQGITFVTDGVVVAEKEKPQTIRRDSIAN
jgi:Protein of unknown function (DUF3124)